MSIYTAPVKQSSYGCQLQVNMLKKPDCILLMSLSSVLMKDRSIQLELTNESRGPTHKVHIHELHTYGTTMSPQSAGHSQA